MRKGACQLDNMSYPIPITVVIDSALVWPMPEISLAIPVFLSVKFVCVCKTDGSLRSALESLHLLGNYNAQEFSQLDPIL